MGHDLRSVWLGRMTGHFLSVRVIWSDVMIGLYHNKGGSNDTMRDLARVLLFLQGPEHMPRCIAAYRLIVRPLTTPRGLDVPTSAATTREILAAKGGTVGKNVSRKFG
jgi:hypothetical protein